MFLSITILSAYLLYINEGGGVGVTFTRSLIFYKELEFEFSFGSGFASKNPFRYIQEDCTAMLALNKDKSCSC